MFDTVFSLHCKRSRLTRLRPHKLYRLTSSGIFGSFESSIMLTDSTLKISRDACIVSVICTVENIDMSHVGMILIEGFFHNQKTYYL